MKRYQAYCPASISLIFRVHPNNNLLKMGSTGVSFTINKGVTASVTEAQQTSICFNVKKINFPTVTSAINSLTSKTLKIRLNSPLPLGCGFGLSGASTLATVFSTNRLLKLGKTKKQLIQIAHIAEVKNKTGLGSVITQVLGGCMVRTTPGVCYIVLRLNYIDRKIYTRIINRISTPAILSDQNQLLRINHQTTPSITQINRKVPFEKLIDLSFSFAKKSGLLKNKKMESVIEEVRNKGGHATMAMLGDVIISSKRFEKGVSIKLSITNDTVRLI